MQLREFGREEIQFSSVYCDSVNKEGVFWEASIGRITGKDGINVACVCLSGFPDRRREHVARSWHARVLCRTCEWADLGPLQNPLKERETSTQFRHRSRMWTKCLPLWPGRHWMWQEQGPAISRPKGKYQSLVMGLQNMWVLGVAVWEPLA